jgi:hypothetical protein
MLLFFSLFSCKVIFLQIETIRMKLKMMDERPTGPTISKAPHGYLPLDFVRQMS